MTHPQDIRNMTVRLQVRGIRAAYLDELQHLCIERYGTFSNGKLSILINEALEEYLKPDTHAHSGATTFGAAGIAKIPGPVLAFNVELLEMGRSNGTIFFEAFIRVLIGKLGPCDYRTVKRMVDYLTSTGALSDKVLEPDTLRPPFAHIKFDNWLISQIKHTLRTPHHSIADD